MTSGSQHICEHTHKRGDPIRLPPQYPSYLKPIPINSRSVVAELDGVFRSESGEAQKWLYSTWTAQAAPLKYQEIANAIGTGEISPQVVEDWRQSYSAYVNDRLAPAWDAAGLKAAANIADGLDAYFGPGPESEAPVSFALDWVNTRGSQFVVQITESQRQASVAIIKEYGVRQGLNEREVAMYLRPTVGLYPQQAMAVAKYRAALIDAGHTGRTLSHLVENYSAYLHRARATMIARTELTWAYNQGQLDSVKEWKKLGWIPNGTAVVKVWETHANDKTCPFCLDLDGAAIGIDETFPGATEKTRTIQTPPAHPNCACVVNFAILAAKSLAALDDWTRRAYSKYQWRLEA